MSNVKVVVVPEIPKTGRTIFLLTCLKITSGQVEIIKRQRTWGWFSTLADAVHAVMTNATDMYEDGYYNTALVEEVAEGTIATTVSEHWFSAKMLERNDYIVEKMAKPAFLKGMVSFGMG